MTIKHVTRNSVCRLAGVKPDNLGALQTACGITDICYGDRIVIVNNTRMHPDEVEIPRVTCSACKVEIDRALDYGAVRTLKLEK